MGYLHDRGISAEVASTFLLGYVEEPVIGHDEFKNWLCIPFVTPSGVVALKFRRIAGDANPKYLSDGDSRLYNVGALHRSSDMIAICEGELDTIILDGVVGIPAIGVPGVSSWKKHYPRVLEGYERVLIFADNDVKDSGDNPGMDMAKRICREVPQAVTVSLPKGRDVNSTYLEEGADALLDLVKG